MLNYRMKNGHYDDKGQHSEWKALFVYLYSYMFLNHGMNLLFFEQSPPRSWIPFLLSLSICEDVGYIIVIGLFLIFLRFPTSEVKVCRLQKALCCVVLILSLLPAFLDMCMLFQTGTKFTTENGGEVKHQ
eukprot:Awhi_evm1s9397